MVAILILVNLNKPQDSSNKLISPLSDTGIVEIIHAVEPTPTPRIVKASWYGISDSECLGCSKSRRTASGEIFDENAMTAACNSERYVMGQLVKLEHNGNTVSVKCNDTGGFSKYSREFDLSKAAFAKLAPLSSGVIKVEVLWP